MLIKTKVETDWDAADYTDILKPGSLWIDKTGMVCQLHCTFDKTVDGNPMFILVHLNGDRVFLRNTTCGFGLHKHPVSAFGGSFSSFKPFYGKITIESKRQ